jgi:lipoprotein-releasing system permease protein
MTEPLILAKISAKSIIILPSIPVIHATTEFKYGIQPIIRPTVLTDIYTVRRLNGWEDDKCTGIEVALSNYEALETARDSVAALIDEAAEKNYEKLYVRTVEEINPSLFAWLDILDGTVWVILVLVLAVAGFTMISGLLILILEKSNLIGILKALGSKDISIRRIFLYYAMFIIGRGMLWGNIMGLVICLVQYYSGIIKLDAEMYYMDRVPIEFSWWLLPLNVAMFLLSTAMLVLPSMLISRIEPTKAIRFE